MYILGSVTLRIAGVHVKRGVSSDALPESDRKTGFLIVGISWSPTRDIVFLACRSLSE